MFNKYWNEQWSAVKFGGMLRNDQVRELFDYVAELEVAVRLAMNENNIPRWIEVSKLMDRGPLIPED